MAVAVVVDFDGATLDQYDDVIERMGFAPGSAGAPGALFHWVAKTNGGICVTDVWESREQYERFAAAQIGPYAQEAGMPGPPRVTFHDVHNHLTAG
jgi:hypothetical protein